jgi:hypothetical protein
MANKTEQRKIEIIADAKKAEASIKDMRAGVALLNNQLNKLPQGTKEFAQKAEELRDVKKRLKEVSDEAKQIGPAMESGNMGTKLLTTGTNGLKMAFKAAVAALLPLFAFQKLVELATHFFGVSDQVNKLKGNIQTLTGATGGELDGLTAQVQALSTTFEKDYNEVLKAGNTLAKQMGISHDEAFTLIEKGLLAGSDLNGDFLEQIAEYAPQFKAAGVEAEDFVAQLVRAEQEGIFSDKGADVIKEFGLRIREQTKASREALTSAFGGDFTEELFAGINDGSVTTVEALQRVSKQMADSGATASELQTVVADVFGGPGEDAGLAYLQNLQDIGGELDDMIDVTNAVTARKLAQLTVEKELAAAQVELGAELGPLSTGFSSFADVLQTYVIQGIVAMLRYFQDVKFAAVGVVEAVKALASNFSTLFQAIVSGDFSAITDAFTNLGSGVSDAYQEGYEESEAVYQMQRIEAKKEAAAEEAAADQEGLAQQAMAREKAHQEEQQKLQEHAQKLAEERKKAKEAEIAAEQALEDLRVEMISDSTERELAALQLKHQRELEQLQGTEAQKEEMRRFLDEQYREERAEIEEERREAELEKQEEDLEAELERLDAEEEMRRLKIEEQYINAHDAEAAKNMAMLDLQQQYLATKLALLEESGQGESTQAQKLKSAILKIEKEKNDQIIAQDKEREALRKQIQQEGVAAAFDVMNLLVGFAEQEADERVANLDQQIEALKAKEGGEEQHAVRIAQLEEQKAQIQREAAKKRQKLEIGEAIVAGIREVAQIWAQVMSLGPIAGPIVGGILTGVAIGRTALNIRKIRQQQYATGGFTSALQIDGSGKMIDSSGHAVAGVVHENEWVAPKWMVESPRHANVIGWLESERTRRFADGGMTSPASGSAGNMPDTQAMQQQLSMLQQDFRDYAARVDAWARQLQVHNDVRETRDALATLNRIDEQSSIR